MKKILLLEDDRSLNKGISLRLKKEGYQVYSAFSIDEAREIFSNAKNEIWLLISDITLPDGSGMDFCREVRERSDLYLMYLTALDKEVDIVNGYDSGADDYMTKPFSLLVLISKVNALWKRSKETGDSREWLISGTIRVLLNTMQVYRDEEMVLLSRKEVQLLLYFLEHAGRIVTKEQILEQVWDAEGQFVDENTVTVNISRLKNKLKTEAISNVRGLGYLWKESVIRK